MERRSRKKYRPMVKSAMPAAARTHGACHPVTRAESHDCLLKPGTTLARKNAHIAGGPRRGPIDFLTRQIARIVERPGIAEIARLPHAGIQLDVLSVAEGRKRFAISRIEGHLGAGM